MMSCSSPACAARRRLPLIALFLLTLLSGARADNPGVATVSDLRPYDRVIAISDVHGEFAHAETLLRAAGVIDSGDRWIGGHALMVVVGDSIDKGPQSVEVLRLWMRLQPEAERQGGRLIVLLGNHEAEFLARPAAAKAEETRADLTALHLDLTDLTDASKPLGAFLRSLPLAARVGDWVFCHAGWIPDAPWPAFVSQARTVLNSGKYDDPLLLASDSILEKKAGATGKKWWRSGAEIRELERRLNADGLAGVVMGHQPGALEIKDNVGESPDGRIFKVDSGMAPVAGEEDAGGGSGQPYAGHLLIFTHPEQLIGKRPTAPDAVSVAAAGTRAAVVVADPPRK